EFLADRYSVNGKNAAEVCLNENAYRVSARLRGKHTRCRAYAAFKAKTHCSCSGAYISFAYLAICSPSYCIADISRGDRKGADITLGTVIRSTHQGVDGLQLVILRVVEGITDNGIYRGCNA